MQRNVLWAVTQNGEGSLIILEINGHKDQETNYNPLRFLLGILEIENWMLLLKSLKDVETILETNLEIIWPQADHQMCCLSSLHAQGLFFFLKKK